MKRTTFLISPVRGADMSALAKVVERLEVDGWSVYWPARDTNQSDESGLRICRDNLNAIARSAYVHVVWDGASQGVLFDLGRAFALDKPVVINGVVYTYYRYLPPAEPSQSVLSFGSKDEAA